MNKYIGCDRQVFGVTEYRLVGGKGDGMRMLRVKNGKGLDLEISLDRCADIVTLSVDGKNMGYLSPCGYVAPQYYEKDGLSFLKSFSAGFFTTCGLTAVGNPCIDDGEELGLHGTVSNTPCESFSYEICDNKIHIKATVRDAALFAHKLILEREYIISLDENQIMLKDKVKNIGFDDCPYEILYHCNMGYPLLSENSVIKIPSSEVLPRDDNAKDGLDRCLNIESPTHGYVEKCYYHILSGKPTVSIFNPDINKGLEMSFDTKELKCFTQWKMMGEGEYVLGLEPGNCYPDGRDVMREKGMLEFIKSGETKTNNIMFRFI